MLPVWVHVSMGYTAALRSRDPDQCAVLPAGPLIFPAFACPTRWRKAHFLTAAKLPCLPVQSGPARAARVGAWLVLQSVGKESYGIIVDADTIVQSTVMLSGVRVAVPSKGTPVAHYRASLHNLAVRFPAPYATAKPRMVRATGRYRVLNATRYACFESAPLPTCAQAVLSMAG